MGLRVPARGSPLHLCWLGVGPAVPQQYVVIYVEFKPSDTKAGSRVLADLASNGLNSAGIIRFDVLQQVDRPNFFALFEIWTSAQTYAAYKNSSTTQAILTQLAPLLEAPLDERDGNLLEGSVTPRSGHAEARQIFVITHLDIIPDFVAQARPVLNKFVSDSTGDPGVQTFAMLSWTPTTNHFQLIEVFANQQAFDAHVSAHTRWTFGAISRRPSARPTMNGSISSSTGDVTGPTKADVASRG
jgi:Uncharacterized conserved protein